jgi:hypothetical protein
MLAFDSYSAPVDAGAFNTNGMHGVFEMIKCGSGCACAMNIDISMSMSVCMSVCLSMCIFVFLYFGIISLLFLRLNVEILLT